MNFSGDPTIERKIMRMSHRVRWQHPAIYTIALDQTRLVIKPLDLNSAEHPAFHFLVLGDSETRR